jgi:prophage maintenance system killer protein
MSCFLNDFLGAADRSGMEDFEARLEAVEAFLDYNKRMARVFHLQWLKINGLIDLEGMDEWQIYEKLLDGSFSPKWLKNPS